ncbi:MAG: sulfatase-like hydrolase/transferase, partial [Verrucomicrobiota bacterium]
FFLYLANTMPHVPLFVSDDRWSEDPKTAYKKTIEHIDFCVGRIVDALKEEKLLENTFIIYTSDNGPWLSKQHHGGSALPLRAGKGSTWEGGMRVPTVMHWPARIKPGQVCDGVAATIDLLPTFAAIVGAEMPKDRPIDGLDISGLLDDPKAQSPRDTTGYFYYKNNRPEAVRLGKWKLAPGRKELYDLDADIRESRNLYGSNPETVDQLTKLIAAYDADLKANARPSWGNAGKKKKKKKAKQ